MALQTPVGIGFIGAGMISEQYLTNLAQYPDVRVVTLGDLDVDRARVQADARGVPFAGSPAEVLAHPDVQLVVNLTIPAAHVEVSLQALEAGKHVWSEKPIGVDLASARGLLARADELGLRVGIAPDTVLGRGCRAACVPSSAASSARRSARRPSCNTRAPTCSIRTRSSSSHRARDPCSTWGRTT